MCLSTNCSCSSTASALPNQIKLIPGTRYIMILVMTVYRLYTMVVLEHWKEDPDRSTSRLMIVLLWKVVIVWIISNLLSRQQKLHLFIFSAFEIRNQLSVFLPNILPSSLSWLADESVFGWFWIIWLVLTKIKFSAIRMLGHNLFPPPRLMSLRGTLFHRC